MADHDKPKIRVGTVSLGITVIALYVLFVGLVAFGFGSYIYRTGWQSDVSAGKSPGGVGAEIHDIDSLLFILKREEDLNHAKLGVSEDIRLQSIKMSDIETQHSRSFGEIAAAKIILRAQVDSTLAKMTEFQYELDGPKRVIFETAMEHMYATIDEQHPDKRAKTAESQLRSLMRTLETGLKNSDVDLDTVDRYRAVYGEALTELDMLSNALDVSTDAELSIKMEKAVLQTAINDLRERWLEHHNQILALQETLPPGNAARARLSALSLNTPIMPDILMRLVSFPTIFLTLIVTIAAGGLGTVVAFSRRYYSSKHADTLTLSRLFVNVGEGIAAAIAIFLFSGAGMLALTQGSGPANEVELSPYTVAFIAFLSGFMAEDAFASIQSAGKRIFQPDSAVGQVDDKTSVKPEKTAEG